MNRDEINRLQESWAKINSDSDIFVERFYAHLFELDPELKSLFHRNMGRQGRKIMSMFTSAIEHLETPGEMIPPLMLAGERHAQYDVKPQDYETVNRALLMTLKESLGSDFSSEVEIVWQKAYRTIQNIMRRSTQEAIKQINSGKTNG